MTKISLINFKGISQNLNKPKSNQGKSQEHFEESVSLDGGEILGVYSRAIQNIKNSKTNIEELKNKTEKIVSENFLSEEEKIYRFFGDSEANIIRCKIGEKIAGFKDLYDETKRAACYYDKEGNIKYALLKNNKTKEIDFIDFSSNKRIHYSKKDMDALYYYKYHPDAIHNKLRKGKDTFNGDFQKEADEASKHLSKMFEDEEKISRTNEDIVLYRALQDDLSDEEKNKLSTIGEKFEEKSFCSTTTDFSTAQRFACGKPILQIEFPKGSKYIDIEKTFNVDLKHWDENELLLNKNSQFIVTGFDYEKNIIKVRYSEE